MNRKTLIERYLSADATPEEERLLAQSFASFPPEGEEEKAVAELLGIIGPVETEPLEDASDQFDQMVRSARKRAIRIWSLTFSGVAAVLLAVVFLHRKPESVETESPSTMELLQQLQLISNMDPAEAEDYEFRPVGDGFIMTARFKDGSEASYILTPMDGGNTFHLVSMNN